MTDIGIKPRASLRHVAVPRPIQLTGLAEPRDNLVVVGMPCMIDSVVAQLRAPANLRNSAGQPWNSPQNIGTVVVQLYQPGGETVFEFRIPVSFRERKRYTPPLAAVDRFDSDLPLLARISQNVVFDTDGPVPATASVDLVVHLIPDFYEG